MPRPKSLTPAQLAAAALAVLDSAGPGGLTMRAVAGELGISTMAVYRYVSDRAALEVLVCDHLLLDLDNTAPPAQWTDQITTLIARVRTKISAHPNAIPLLVANRQRSAGVQRWGEAVLAVLATAGFAGPERVIAFRGLVGYVMGALLQEDHGPLAGEGTVALTRLPTADFPLLAETAAAARSVTPDQEFLGGLAIYLRGLEPVRGTTADSHIDEDQSGGDDGDQLERAR